MSEQFMLERDGHGFAVGISVGGYWVVHLTQGTVRNEQCAEWLVDRLNGGDSRTLEGHCSPGGHNAD